MPASLSRAIFGLGRRLPAGTVRLINLARGIDAPKPVELPPGQRVAVVAPHPDDELIGPGGTMAKHIAAGHAVEVVMVTSGEGSASFVGSDAHSARRQREEEAVAALEVLGLERLAVRFLRLPERRLEAESHLALSAALGEIGPDLVYAPSPGDSHAGHAAVSRMLARCLAELPGSPKVALYEVMTPVVPNVVVDVSSFIELKSDALSRYTSALASVDFVRTSRALAAFRSVHAGHGAGYAEAFSLLSGKDFVALVAGFERS